MLNLKLKISHEKVFRRIVRSAYFIKFIRVKKQIKVIQWLWVLKWNRKWSKLGEGNEKNTAIYIGRINGLELHA